MSYLKGGSLPAGEKGKRKELNRGGLGEAERKGNRLGRVVRGRRLFPLSLPYWEETPREALDTKDIIIMD